MTIRGGTGGLSASGPLRRATKTLADKPPVPPTAQSLERRQSHPATAGEQRTDQALRSPRDADPSAVMNQTVREVDPLRLRNKRHQILFDLFRVGALHQAQQVGDSLDVRVDNDAAGDPPNRPEHDIGL